jgi:uncharacterized repeat protein (TIGR03803 family)
VLLVLCAIAASATLAAGQAGSGTGAAPQFRVIRYMNEYVQPGGMAEGSPGVFYSSAGSGYQAALSLTTQGAMTILAKFPLDYSIAGPLVSAADGRFYSAVYLHLNPASVFSVASAPGSKQLYPPQSLFPVPVQNLADGTLLATATSASSAFYLAKCDLRGTVTPIYAFPSTERLTNPAISASDGNYYGVSYVQDASGYVYRISPSGSLTKVCSFPIQTFVGNPGWAPLLQASDGNLYGATPNGGANGTGTIYKLTLGGQYTLLYSFPAGSDYNPAALIEGSDGNLYGATLGDANASLLFRVTKSGHHTLVHKMNPYTDGQCQCQLTQGSDGIIYGSALAGGVTGAGTYFALDVGLPKPSPRARQFHPKSGAVGTQVRIWGNDLLSVAVHFNGVTATAVSNSGPNYVWATVPTGATTGPITVTTPGGTYTTHASFMVP